MPLLPTAEVASHAADVVAVLEREIAGADAADALLVRRQSLEVSWRLGDLEELEREEQELQLDGFTNADALELGLLLARFENKQNIAPLDQLPLGHRNAGDRAGAERGRHGSEGEIHGRQHRTEMIAGVSCGVP